LSPLILGRGGDLRVLRTKSRGDVHSGKDLSPLPHLKNQLKKFNLKLKMPLKWQLNLKLRRSLKDPILKMETPMRRVKNIAWGDRNALTQSFWEITMSG
jgi:predicted  nucleic acid-binding Zn ribbon protein